MSGTGPSPEGVDENELSGHITSTGTRKAAAGTSNVEAPEGVTDRAHGNCTRAPGGSASDPGHQVDLLSQMVEEISGELALEPLLARIVERACNLIGADDGAIGLYEQEFDWIRTAANCNIPDSQLSSVLPRGTGLLGRVLEVDGPVHCRYAELPCPIRAAAINQTVIGMPIRTHGELIGVFGIGVSPPRQFGAAAQGSLAVFARHAGVAIDNARRYALEQRRAARFALIVRVAGIIASGPDIETVLQRAADVIHELLGYANVDVPLIDVDDRETLVVRIRGGDHKRLIRHEDRLSIHSGIMGAAVRECRVQLVNDVAQDPRYVKPPGVTAPLAELAVPILFGDEVLGVLNVEDRQAFDELDQQSLEVIAEHLALAIQSARLFDHSRQLALLEERQRLARDLHDNVTQILSSISMISQSLVDSWEKDPAAGALRAARLSQLAQMGFSELRELLRELSPITSSGCNHGTVPPQVPHGGLQLQQDGLAATAGYLVLVMLPSHMALSIDFDAYCPQTVEHEKTLLRICQEAASNAIRHTNASRLEIEAGVDEDHAWLRVSDNGQGFSVGNPPGMGISNMCHRLLSLGGAFHVASQLPRGIRIEARLPRQDRTP